MVLKSIGRPACGLVGCKVSLQDIPVEELGDANKGKEDDKGDKAGSMPCKQAAISCSINHPAWALSSTPGLTVVNVECIVD
eukprot:366412-Chlamydomonas_euryale.AAC.9